MSCLRLVSMLQDSIVPTKKVRTAPLNMTAAQSAEIENQFPINSTEEQLLSLSPEENLFLFLTRHDDHQFVTTRTGNQFPALQTSADTLAEDLLAENSPMSFSNQTTEGQFVPNFNNGTPNVAIPTTADQQGAKLQCVEDEAIGSPISEGYAKHVEDCCKTHPSIVKVKNLIKPNHQFSLCKFDTKEVWDEINRLDGSKSVSGNILTTILKKLSALCFGEVTKIANSKIECCLFPESPKEADLSPVFKTGETTAKKNFRPLSVLSAMSKVFERLISKQITSFINPKLSKLLCGFRKGYSPKMLYIELLSNVARYWTGQARLGWYSWICQKPMTAFPMIYC